MRYIGDLLTLNNSKEINPVELSLKRTESCTVVSYLDICICIYMMNNRLLLQFMTKEIHVVLTFIYLSWIVFKTGIWHITCTCTCIS